MKIRELFENVGNTVYHIVRISLSDIPTLDTRTKIVKIVRSKTGHLKNVKINIDKEEVEITIVAPTASYVTNQTVDVYEEISDAIESVADTQMGFNEIHGFWPPEFPIDFDNMVTIQMTSENTSLTGIEKLIIAAEELSIENLKFLKGGLLSVLKLKRVGSIQFNGLTANENQKKAIDIVEKHFHSGKDILACQEDLIENGVKDYAKF